MKTYFSYKNNLEKDNDRSTVSEKRGGGKWRPENQIIIIAPPFWFYFGLIFLFLTRQMVVCCLQIPSYAYLHVFTTLMEMSRHISWGILRWSKRTLLRIHRDRWLTFTGTYYSVCVNINSRDFAFQAYVELDLRFHALKLSRHHVVMVCTSLELPRQKYTKRDHAFESEVSPGYKYMYIWGRASFRTAAPLQKKPTCVLSEKHRNIYF